MRCAILALALAAVAAPLPALAMCGVQVQGVSFGAINVLRREESTGGVRVTCDQPVSFLIEIVGTVSGGERRMAASGGASLRYALYADAAHGQVWGDGQGIGSPVSGTSDGATAEAFTIYGVVPSQPGTLPGDYSDSLLVTLGF
jgi:spore coat protein U-like protein